MYTKLFSSITDSTIWREDDHVRLVWITMLAMTDKFGHVTSSVPGLADRARVTIEKTVDALRVLSSPDEWSRSAENDGRRIRAIGGGWMLLNYVKYSKIRNLDERREYMRKYMQAYRKHPVNNVNSSKPQLAHTDVDLNQTKAEKGSKAETIKNKISNTSEVVTSNSGDVELAVCEIAKLHPKIADSNNLSQEVQHAIASAVARHGRDLVWAGTKNLTEVPIDLIRFIPNPGKYFRESCYKLDPKVWGRSGDNEQRPTKREQKFEEARRRSRETD